MRHGKKLFITYIQIIFNPWQSDFLINFVFYSVSFTIFAYPKSYKSCLLQKQITELYPLMVWVVETPQRFLIRA